MGRPRAIEEKELENLKVELDEKALNNAAPDTEELKGMLNVAAWASAARRRSRVVARNLSKLSLSRYRKRLGLKKRRVPRRPNARVEAEADLRNGISLAVMLKILLDTPEYPVAEELIFNIDTTSIQIQDGKKLAVWVRKEVADMPRKPLARAGPSPLPFHGRIIAVESAAGWLATVVVFVDSTMKGGAFLKGEIRGLGQHVGAIGHLWVVPSFRGVDAEAVFKDVLKLIVLPAMRAEREINHLQGHRGLVLVDGEKAQVDAAMDPQIQKAFEEMKADICKLIIQISQK